MLLSKIKQGLKQTSDEKIVRLYQEKTFDESRKVAITCNKKNKLALSLYEPIVFKPTDYKDEEVEIS